MGLDDLLTLIPKEADRREFLRLTGAYHAAARAGDAEAPRGDRVTEAERDALLDEVMQQLMTHFRAIRHPIPTRDDLKRMIATHFARVAGG